MKALVYTQPNEVQLLDRPDPSLEAGEVILKIEAVGICGSDMHAYHGHDPRRKPGLILGHEFCGTVIESASKQYAKGTRVTGNPLITCGVCEYCVQGRNNLCSHRTMVGMTRPGAFAQYMSIPAASLIDMPQDMPAAHAAVTEPAATALHAINLSMRSLVRPLQECRVLILGGGAIGMFAALLLKNYGCMDTTVAEVNPLRRQQIEQYAQVKTYNPKDENPAENAYDYVIDAVGSKITRNTAFASVKAGGVIMHIGLQDWASEVDMRRLTLAEITLLGTYTYTTADLRATVQAIARGAFGSLGWLDVRPMADGAQAFSELDKGQVASAKLILQP
jgi:2-desacetyl-2-hydroxyethyl bacteriochlorophyllide A dehydrogenase